MLNDIYDEIPKEVLKDLSLGVLLKNEEMLHKESVPEKPLYILGQYVRSNLGRQVVLYYGSFMKVHGHLPEEGFKEKLAETLYHELTHHMEDLGGEWDLEKDDFIQLQKYKSS